MLFEEGKGLSLDDLKKEQETQEGIEREPKQEPTQQTEPDKPVVEEPKPQEPKAEETKPVEDKADPPQGKEETNVFDFASFNKAFNKNYESLDQIKSDLDKPTMEKEYQDQKTAYEELEAKYNDLNETYGLLSEQLDPSSYFSSEEAMKLEVFRKQNPKKDAAIASKVFSTEDLSSIDDLEMVKMGIKFKSPKLRGTEKDLEASIAEEFGQDPDSPVSEWSVSAQNRLTMRADEYRDAFDQMKSSVKLPERVNIEELKTKRQQALEERKTALQEGWSKIADETLSKTNQLDVPIGEAKEGEEQKFFKWDLGSPPKEEVERLKEDFISFGLDPNGELFQESLNNVLLNKYLPTITQKMIDDALARQKEEFLNQTNNTEPLKDSVRPDLSDKEKQMKERSAFALEGLGSRFRPIF